MNVLLNVGFQRRHLRRVRCLPWRSPQRQRDWHRHPGLVRDSARLDLAVVAHAGKQAVVIPGAPRLV